jgi:hypothetical protein
LGIAEQNQLLEETFGLISAIKESISNYTRLRFGQNKSKNESVNENTSIEKILILDANELTNIADSGLLMKYYECCEMISTGLTLTSDTSSIDANSMSHLKNNIEKAAQKSLLWSINVIN